MKSFSATRAPYQLLAVWFKGLPLRILLSEQFALSIRSIGSAVAADLNKME